MNIYEKLNAARAQFHSLKLEKTGHNKFAGYNYFELGDFLIPALSVFKECGLCAVVSFESATATMTIVDIADPQSVIRVTSPMGSAALKGCHEVQNIGAVETYQRRYLWVAALEIVEHDALDATTGSVKPDTKKAPINNKASGPELIFQELQPEEQDYCRKVAARVVALMPDVSRVIDMLDSEGMDAEAKTGVWYLLDSGTRSAIKKAQDAQKAPA